MPASEPALSWEDPHAVGPQPGERVLLGLLLLLTFLLGCTQMRSTDIWFHMRTGQLILERGDVPRVDWYTYTDWDNQWIDLHWLFQVLAACLHASGGVELLVITKALCLAMTVAIGWAASGTRLPGWAKTLVWVLPIVCLSGRALVRPEMLTLVFLATWLWVLFGVQQKPGRIWWLPAVQLLWTNCHGLFVLGPVVGVAYLVDRGWRSLTRNRWAVRQSSDALSAQRLMAVIVLTALASLVNPYAEEGALYPFVLFGELSDLGPTENQPPLYFIRHFGFANVFLLAEIGVWLMTFASFLWVVRYKRFDMMRLVLFVGFSYLAWRAQRNTNIFSLVCGVVCCLNCADALRLRAAERDGRGPDSLPSIGVSRTPWRNEGRSPKWPAQLLCTVLVAGSLCVVSNTWSRWNGEGNKFGIGERESYFIHDAALFAGQEGFPETALIAQFGQAAVYVFHNAPERRVFLDGRLDVVSPETERAYFEILSLMAAGDPLWEERVRDSAGRLPAVILDSRYSRPLINGMLSNPHWRLVYADESAAVFIDVPRAERLGLLVADDAPLIDPPE